MPWPRKISLFGRGSGRPGPKPESDLEMANRLISQARDEWVEMNGKSDDTDVVTPYDEWFYKERKL